MDPNPELLLTLASSPVPGAAQISLTDALLVLCFGGLLVAAYQLNRVVQRLGVIERRLPAVRVRPEQATPPGPPGSGALPPHVLAAIVAACEEEFDAPARIVSISHGTDQKQVWSMEGRRQIFASHQVR